MLVPDFKNSLVPPAWASEKRLLLTCRPMGLHYVLQYYSCLFCMHVLLVQGTVMVKKSTWLWTMHGHEKEQGCCGNYRGSMLQICTCCVWNPRSNLHLLQALVLSLGVQMCKCHCSCWGAREWSPLSVVMLRRTTLFELFTTHNVWHEVG